MYWKSRISATKCRQLEAHQPPLYTTLTSRLPLFYTHQPPLDTTLTSHLPLFYTTQARGRLKRRATASTRMEERGGWSKERRGGGRKGVRA